MTDIITERFDPALVEADLLAFLEQHTKRPWTAEENLFAGGGVSSLFALELVVHLEQAFGVQVTGNNLTISNFQTVRTMTELVGRLLPGGGGSSA